MQLRRLDDYQSWQVDHCGASVLIDPWLTPEAISGAFDRTHTAGFITLDAIQRSAPVSAVLLCAAVSDHLRPRTLEALGDAHVHGPPRAARAAGALGCRSISHRPGDRFEVACPEGGSLRITVTQTGRPLGRIAVGYLIDAVDGERQLGRIWIDPHLPTVSLARRLAPVDLAILPTESVLAGIVPATAGPRRVAAVALAARAGVLVPTATDPGRDMTWWQRRIYRVAGGTAEVRAHLAGAPTQVVDLSCGARIEVKPAGAPPRGSPAARAW